MRVSSWPFVPKKLPKKLQQTNRQDMVFISPPGISDGRFQLRINNVWFCKLLLLFKIDTKTDAGMKKLFCAFVSVLEEYNSHRHPVVVLHNVYILHILHILPILHILDILKLVFTEGLDKCQSTSVYKSQESVQVLYVVPVSSILGLLPLVPVGSTGTIPFEMRR
jgi:hypothetical protein